MKVNDSTIVGGFGDYADYQHIMKLLNQQTIDDAVIGKWYDYLLYFKFQFTTYFIIWFMCGYRIGWKLTCFKYKNYWQLIYSRWTAEHLTLVHLRVSYYFMIVNSSKVCKWSKPAIEKKIANEASGPCSENKKWILEEILNFLDMGLQKQ